MDDRGGAHWPEPNSNVHPCAGNAGSAFLVADQEEAECARVLIGRGSADLRSEIQASLDRASGLVGATRAVSFEPQIHVERARLAGLCSDPGGHRQWLQEAHRLFSELGAKGRAETVTALLA